MHYNYFRDYHPRIGRYVEPDPSHYPRTNTPLVLSSLAYSPTRLHDYVYAANNPIAFLDQQGLKAFRFIIGPGGGVGHFVFGGGVYHAEITDMSSGTVCMYTVTCFGIGVGLPEINVTSKPVIFSVDDECTTCSDFQGNGYVGGISLVPGGGVTIGGGVQIPNGPFLPGELLEGNYGGIRISVSHSVCYFHYRGRR
jgi:RHS repeat-associated protein